MSDGGIFCFTIILIFVGYVGVGVWISERKEKALEARSAEIRRQRIEAGLPATVWEERQLARKAAAHAAIEQEAREKAAQIAAVQAEEARRAQLGLMSLDEVLLLTPTQFEEVIAYSMTFWGYSNVRRVGGANDQGVDVTGIDRDGKFVVVQCKRYAPGQKVSSGELQMFNGNVHGHAASYGIFVTTSDYTAPARSLARKYGIKIVDGTSLDWRVRRYHFDA